MSGHHSSGDASLKTVLYFPCYKTCDEGTPVMLMHFLLDIEVSPEDWFNCMYSEICVYRTCDGVPYMMQVFKVVFQLKKQDCANNIISTSCRMFFHCTCM